MHEKGALESSAFCAYGIILSIIFAPLFLASCVGVGIAVVIADNCWKYYLGACYIYFLSGGSIYIFCSIVWRDLSSSDYYFGIYYRLVAVWSFLCAEIRIMCICMSAVVGFGTDAHECFCCCLVLEKISTAMAWLRSIYDATLRVGIPFKNVCSFIAFCNGV